VKIPIPELLMTHRRRAVEQGLTPTAERIGIGAFAFAAERPQLWSAGTAVGRAASAMLVREGRVQGGWVPLLRDWIAERDLAPLDTPSFRQRWQRGLLEGES
jgi:L-lactate dehydrogenase complex protein LldF